MPVASSRKFSGCLSGIGFADSKAVERNKHQFDGFDKQTLLNEDSKQLILATKLAIESAQINLKEVDPARIGVIVSTVFGSFSSYENFYKGLKSGNLQPIEFSLSLSNTAASLVTMFFKLKGPCLTLPEAGISDLISVAKMFIENEMVDVVIAGFYIAPSVTLTNYLGINTSAFSIVGLIESVESCVKRNHAPYFVI